MKKLFYIIPVLALLSAGCNDTKMSYQSLPISGEVQSHGNKCSEEKIEAEDIVARISALNKQDAASGMFKTQTTTLKEVFYSPKLQQCMFIITHDAIMNDNRNLISLYLYKVPLSVSVWSKEDQIAMVAYIPDNMPKYQARLDEFNKTLKEYH